MRRGRNWWDCFGGGVGAGGAPGKAAYIPLRHRAPATKDAQLDFGFEGGDDDAADAPANHRRRN